MSADERGDAPSAGPTGPGRARAVLDEIEARLEPPPGAGPPSAEGDAEGDAVAEDTTEAGEPPD